MLVAHSIGGAVATAIAATPQSWPLLGLATSGCLVRVPAESAGAWAALPDIPMIDLPVPLKDQLMFGPADTYDDAMPAASYPSNTLVPKAELLDITGGWIDRRAETCGRVTVPVHHRQGEFDHLWVTSQDEIDEFRRRIHLGGLGRRPATARRRTLHRLPPAERRVPAFAAGVRDGRRERWRHDPGSPAGRPGLPGEAFGAPEDVVIDGGVIGTDPAGAERGSRPAVTSCRD